MSASLDQNIARATAHLARFRERLVAHLIDGAPDPGDGQTFETLRRSTTPCSRRSPRGGAAEIDRAAAGRAGGRSRRWRDMPGADRRDLLHGIADAIEARADEIALRRDAWTPASRSASCRRRRCAARRTSASSPIARRTPRDGLSLPTATHFNYTIRQPIGPVGIITPWNTPFMLSTWKIAPALAAGCTVVHKPAEWSPLTATLLAEIAIEAGLPPGVLNTVHGFGEEAGNALTEHPDIKAIGFVGESATGSADHGARARRR